MRAFGQYTESFIGSSLAVETDGFANCVYGATITLFRGPTKVDETVSDTFGDFKFDHLKENNGTYRLEAVHPDYSTKMLEVDLKISVNVSTIWL